MFIMSLKFMSNYLFEKSFQYSNSMIKNQYNEALGWIREIRPFADSANA